MKAAHPAALIAFAFQAHAVFGTPAESMTVKRKMDAEDKAGLEPNPPNWPASVKFLHPSMTTEEIRRIVQPTEDPKYTYPDIFHDNVTKVGHNTDRHFTNERFALMFHPGTYTNIDVEVGYYVQLAGLGRNASSTQFQNCKMGPYVEAVNKRDIVGGRLGLSLDTFWRSAENFAVIKTADSDVGGDMLWAVSQAAPLRRVHIQGDLKLHDKGAQASGGVLANAIIEGNVEFGSQQQYICRSVTFNGKEKMEAHNEYTSAWNAVFVDCSGDALADGNDGKGIDEKGNALPCIVRDDSPKIVVDKPYVSVKDDGKSFELRVPKVRVRGDKDAKFGPDLTGEDDDVRDFTKVKLGVANSLDLSTKKEIPNTNVADELQAALDAGKDIVLAPGMYYLDKPLLVKRSNQVVLGLGLATLVAPSDGSPCIKVAPKLEGVRIAGIMLEASEVPADRTRKATMLEWGEEGVKDAGNPLNPGALTDIFARVGGSNLSRDVATDTMVVLHSANIYGDNLWLWRADHVLLRPEEEANFKNISYHYRQTVKGEVPAKTGLEVNGDDVVIHGLAVEHTTEHQTIWRGERGNVQFYQCELPYDVCHEFSKANHLGYFVEDNVKEHHAAGVGVYSNFRDHDVHVEMAIKHPESNDIKIDHVFTVKLDNTGVIRSLVNGIGPAATEKGIPTRLE